MPICALTLSANEGTALTNAANKVTQRSTLLKRNDDRERGAVGEGGRMLCVDQIVGIFGCARMFDIRPVGERANRAHGSWVQYVDAERVVAVLSIAMLVSSFALQNVTSGCDARYPTKQRNSRLRERENRDSSRRVR